MTPPEPKFIGLLRELRPHVEKIAALIEERYPKGPPHPSEAGLPATFMEQFGEEEQEALAGFIEGSGMGTLLRALAVYDGELDNDA